MTHQRTTRTIPGPNAIQLRKHAVALAVGCAAFPGQAMDFQITDDVKLKVNSTATFGTTLRTESPDPANYGVISAARVGLAPGQLGPNSGGSNLNFERGKPVSTVIKAVADLELLHRNVGFFTRVKAWHDFELKEGNRPYGNSVNGFAQNAPLSDSGFDPAAKFSNVRLADVYAFGKFMFEGESSLDVRLGRQSVNWGGARLSSGGVSSISPVDLPATLRPGAQPQEMRVPVGMLYFNLAATKQWGLEGFLPYEFRPTVLPGCGTFYAPNGYTPVGCGYASVLPTLDDQAAFASGRYIHRREDVLAKKSGQFGLSGRYTAGSINTEFRGYVVNYHSVLPSFRAYNANVDGGYGALATTRLTDPNGLAYGLIYPEDIRLYAMSFVTRFGPAVQLYGEAAYRPNQPLTLNASDLLGAFFARSPNSALNLARGTNAIPPGGTYDGHDRFKVTNLSLGANGIIPKTLGADRVVVTGEIGWSHVSSLPASGVLRYGRSDEYGTAAINGLPCTDTTTARKACAHNGFVTSNAWGYRVRAIANYPGGALGADWTPSITFAHDVRGYSYDGSLNEGRMTLRSSLRAEWNKKYFGEVQYTRIWGGTYNNRTDRDTLTLFAGMRL